MPTDYPEEAFGSSVERREDAALVTGEAEYTADISLPGTAHAAILRSRYAHARIESIDTSDAEAHEGVVAVYTGADIDESGIPNDIPTAWLLPGLVTPQYKILATEKTRHTGDGIAVVVAEDRYIAQDALGLIDVTYERLDAVTDPAAAVEENAPTVHEEAPDNVAFDWELGDGDAVDEAFESAAHTAEVDLVQQRIIPNAMEPRAALADFDTATEKLTLWMTSQNPHPTDCCSRRAHSGFPSRKSTSSPPRSAAGSAARSTTTPTRRSWRGVRCSSDGPSNGRRRARRGTSPIVTAATT